MFLLILLQLPTFIIPHSHVGSLFHLKYTYSIYVPQAQVVQTLDSSIHRLNLYPLDMTWGYPKKFYTGMLRPGGATANPFIPFSTEKVPLSSTTF